MFIFVIRYCCDMFRPKSFSFFREISSSPMYKNEISWIRQPRRNAKVFPTFQRLTPSWSSGFYQASCNTLKTAKVSVPEMSENLHISTLPSAREYSIQFCRLESVKIRMTYKKLKVPLVHQSLTHPHQHPHPHPHHAIVIQVADFSQLERAHRLNKYIQDTSEMADVAYRLPLETVLSSQFQCSWVILCVLTYNHLFRTPSPHTHIWLNILAYLQKRISEF